MKFVTKRNPFFFNQNFKSLERERGKRMDTKQKRREKKKVEGPQEIEKRDPEIIELRLQLEQFDPTHHCQKRKKKKRKEKENKKKMVRYC